MPKNKRETVYLRGKGYWMKIFDAPRPNYGGDAREWTFEFEPDEASIELLEEHDLGDRLKDKSNKKGYEGRGKFLTLKRGEFDYEGNPNEHIRVVDAANTPFPDKTLIGNESEIDVKVSIVDYGVGRFKGIYPIAIRVLELVPYQSEEFAPLPTSDPRRKAAESRKGDFERDFGLDTPDETEPEAPAPKPSGRKKAVLSESELDDDMPLE
jgi:hypothetical protein